ncbi:cysteine-rich receptor-like protein kinase 1 [Durio zibethinus]|uniref:Cysteine-rich receptor-like protein kinase 1 n=1 Tax=Durio zibethinus TaxID=66656 RepID=A0A6P5Y9Z5_DURZI|nr:cysteine-rich receptor-like protein kinase 1 [Durio zibethinus]
MRFSNPYPWDIIIWVYLIFSSCFLPSFSHHQAFRAHLMCGTTNETSQTFIRNVNKVMGALSELVAAQGWGIFSVIDPPFNVFGLGQCYDDVNGNDCRICFDTATEDLKRCIHATSGRIYLDRCFQRFDNYSFYNEGFDANYDHVMCGSPKGVSNDSYIYQDFQNKLDLVVMNVTKMALKNNGYAATEVKGGLVTIYALAQCWKTIDKESCRECLRNAGLGLRKCAPGAEGKGMFSGCYMRYSTNRFFDQVAETNDNQGFGHWVIIGMALAAIAFTLLAGVGALISYKRLSKKKEGLDGLDDIPAAGNKTSLNFKYETLEKATESFDESRKLGQGGAGSVFKGILPNGKTVAVKRLFFNTRQWVDQFFNEVNLISGIQHKNLVKLLGCSIEGPESLLVYQYVPNRSLDQILFVKNTIHILSWSQRFNIICGTAEGLAYLHGGSGVKIIHRDIKASNILLDENLTPKIADFGLARCVASDKSHVSTAIAGTLGYMAPEYLVRGQLTEKADVYAFGVLVLEIATGRKNSVFSEGSSSILYSVWKQYKADSITQAIDSGLKGRFDEREATSALLVGLLCTQASVALRPFMSEVVQMLADTSGVIPSPKQPPFLNASVLSPEDTISSSFMGSSALDEPETGPESSTQRPGITASPVSDHCTQTKYQNQDSLDSFSH